MRSDCDSTDYAVISTGLEERIIEEASGKSLDRFGCHDAWQHNFPL